MKSYRQILVLKALGIIRVRVRVRVRRLAWGMKFPNESIGNYRSPGNGISWRIHCKFSFPGEQNFPGNQSENFVSQGTKFPDGSVEKFRSPGNKIFRWISWEFRSPGNGIFQGISWKIAFPGERNFSED